MKSYIFKYLLAIAAFLLINNTSAAQTIKDTSFMKRIIILHDTVVIHDTVYKKLEKDSYFKNDAFTQVSIHSDKRDRRIHRYRHFWGVLIPTNFKMQYAGGMGLFSLGAGWDYGKRGQWETDLMFGYVPKYSKKTSNLVITAKQNYIPWSININKDVDIEPLECGLYMTSIFGDEFWAKEPRGYPSNYYGFATKIRFYVFVGQRAKFQIPDNLNMLAKSVTVFYEINSCDLYLVSAFTNSSLKPTDYLRLSLGVKFQIF